MKTRLTSLLTIAIAFVGFALAAVQSAQAVTITVMNTSDSGTGSLRQALADANDGDTIDFAGAVTGTITLTTGELLVNDSIAISGPGANVLAVDGNHASGVFHIASGKTVTISGLTITNGINGGNGGGIYNDHSTLTVSNCTVSGNSTSGVGGGIYSDGINSGSATLTINNSTLSGNSAGLSGGGIYSDGVNSGSTTLTINNSTLSGSSATVGGGIISDGSNGSATLTINNSTLSGNSASGVGGIYNNGNNSGSATLTINNSTLSGNSASGNVGGIFNNGESPGSATLTIGDTILKTGASGANIVNASGTVTSLGYNLSSDDSSAVLNKSTDQNSTDPKLGPLQDNGGPTFTHALCTASGVPDASCTGASPAIDQGKNFSGSTTDQRGAGFDRTFDDLAIPNATDGDGTDIGAFEVQANTPPTITAATGVTIPQDASVSNSSIATVNDAEDAENTLTVTVNDSSSATTNGITVSNIAVDSSGNVTANIAATCGATSASFTLRVTDSGGLFDEDTLDVAVTPETTPPVITSVSASPSVLKPPNHRLVPVTVSASDSDNCDPNPVCSIIGVTSNEPDSGCGSGDKRNDIQNISGLTVQLRAERCGTLKTGRIYTITVQCTDASGNSATKTTTVTVKK